MKKKKSNKLNLIICAIAFVFMIFYVYFVDGFDNLVNSIQKINVGFLFIAMGLMIVYLSLIHISSPRDRSLSRMPSSA